MNAPFTSMNFDLGHDVDLLRDAVYQFAQGKLPRKLLK